MIAKIKTFSKTAAKQNKKGVTVQAFFKIFQKYLQRFSVIYLMLIQRFLHSFTKIRKYFKVK